MLRSLVAGLSIRLRRCLKVDRVGGLVRCGVFHIEPRTIIGRLGPLLTLKAENVESNGDTAVSRQVCSGSWELIWVVVVLVLTVRTFFFHPMSIPSASMEPNFLGRAVENILGKEERAAPGFLRNWFRFAVYGVREIHIQAKAAGRFEVVDQKPEAFLGIFERQRFRIGTAVYPVWFPPADLWRIAGLSAGARFAAGEDVIRLRVRSGDRMMVNRLLFNLRNPERGESVVFEAEAVPVGPKSSFYLKRLVAFEGEKLRISDGRKLLVDDRLEVVCRLWGI